MLNLSVYLSCAIIQAISFSQLLGSPAQPSTSTYLNALQSTLTQILSAIMTYVLTRHSASSPTDPLGKRYRAWFVLAWLLPVVSFAVLRWSQGISTLLSFVGSAVTGFLQVVLVVDMRGPKVLP
jgi:predicted CDP-diglyceride synthetase/phosphatidate cytidylyltransferase